MSDSWSKTEVAVIVADYFDMLVKELNKIPYKKSDHRRRLLPLLQQRSEGSIEFKHQNISAILMNLGRPYINGYLPRNNYQNLLEDEVLNYLINNSEIDSYSHKFVEKEIVKPQKRLDFEKIVVSPPKILTVNEPKISYQPKPIKINYLEREQSNRSLGLFGEEVVIEFEKWNLIRLGKDNLANRIEWISKDLGDGAGYDILSKNPNGTDKYIEVKTTKLGKETPFFFSSRELQFSIEKTSNYHLYRLFNVENDVKLFRKIGALNRICQSIPIMYKGFF
jgi:hypothetical protein